MLGWTLLSPHWGAVDAVIHPRVLGTPQAERIRAWSVERLAAQLREEGGGPITMMWIDERDAEWLGWLEANGFERRAEAMLQTSRPLADPIPAPTLPPGCVVRRVAGEAESAPRAAASHAAFGSHKTFAVYHERYLSFMHSPVYGEALDIAAFMPDGEVGAFCIAWPDEGSQTGLFEPVGTHPQHRRRGLAKAVLLVGLRMLAQAGMAAAVVCVDEANTAASDLYRSLGFQPERRLLSVSREVS
jgi:ribosomal protein S18 acetylase RimI-like enzyme